MRDSDSPYYMQVKDSLLAMIRSGELKGNAKIPSSAELCRTYGVSLITVRRAVGDLKAEGVLRGEFGKGVFVNGAVPQQDGSPKDKAMAGVWAAMVDENILHVQDGMNRYAQEHGISVELYPCKSNGPEESIEIFRQLAARGINGVVVFPSDAASYVGEVGKMIESGFKFVAVDRGIDALPVSVVSSDNFGGAYLATQHLLRSFNLPVRYLGVNDPCSAVRERIGGYAKAMADIGYTKVEIDSFTHVFDLFERDSKVLLERWKWRPGYLAAAKAVLKGISRFPAAFFCLNDYIARGVYDAAAELGLAIGKDILVVGFDDLAIASRLNPSLSSVRQDFTAMGYRAAALLDSMGTGDRQPLDVRIPVELVLRDSSRVEQLVEGGSK